MKIAIIGHTGFIGSYLYKKLKKKYKVKGYSLRNIDFQKEYKKHLVDFFSADLIVNCAASLNPKTFNDNFINENLMNEILLLNKNFKKVIIHLSSINVLIKDRKDKYTKTKKNCEKLIKKYDRLFILRLPLVIKKKRGILQRKGEIKKIFDFLDLMKFHYCPFIYPGHTYNPIEIFEIHKIIEKIIKKKIRKKIINLNGSKKMNLYEIAEIVANLKNKKLVRVNFGKIYKFLPSILQNIIKHRSNFIQQLAPIDNTKY